MRLWWALCGLGALASGCGAATSQDGPQPAVSERARAAESQSERAGEASAPAGDDTDAPPLAAEDEHRVAAIGQAIRDTDAERHACWARAAADDMALAGDVKLELRFADSSSAIASVLIDEPGDAVLTGCLRELYESYAWPAVFEAGDAIEIPFRFQAPTWQHTVERAHVAAQPGDAASRVDHGATAGVRTQRLLDGQNSGNRAIALTYQTLATGASIPAHSRTATTRVVYVVAGQGRFFGRDPARAVPIEPGQALYIAAGVPYGIAQRGPAPLELVGFETPDQGRAQPGDLVSGGALGALPGAGAMPTLRPMPDIYPLGPPGADGQPAPSRVAIYFDAEVTGEPHAYLGVLTAAPGMNIPLHSHARETEIGFVLSGSAAMTVAGDEYPVGPGTGFQIPPTLKHSATVTGDQPLRMVQLYTPSGPEQRFKGPPGAR